MTKMILYKSCFGGAQQKTKFEINFKKMLTNETSYDNISELLLKKTRKNEKTVDKQRKQWYDVKVASGKQVRTENNFEKS